MGLILSPTQVAFNARGDGNFNKPFQDQLAFFRKKINLPSEHYDDIIKSAHDHAFIVAGATKADLLNDLRGAVDKAIANGKSIEWFRKEFAGIVQKHGWAGWTGSDTAAGRDWRARVIYNTNLSASYAAGRYAQLTDPDLLQNRPYWKYVHNDTVRHPRELHQSWSGTVLHYTHPWWQTHFCPNGYFCRCRITAVTVDEYKGYPAPDDGTYIYKDRAGVEHVLPKGVDYGWDYPPGASVSKTLKPFIDNKVASLPSPLADAFANDVAKVGKAIVFAAQTTAKGCAQWAMTNDLVDFANYGSINVAVANDMNQSLFEHLQEFPMLRQNQKFIGTAQLQFTRWHANATAAYEKALLDKGYTLETAKKFSKKYVKKPKMSGNTWMHSWAQDGVSGIAVNEKWGKNLDGFNLSLEANVQTKWHPVDCKTVKSVCDHEFGHQLDNLLGLSKAGQAAISVLYAEALQSGIKEVVSEYAGKNLQEFIAECWSEAKNSSNPRPMAAKVARLIRDEYSKKFSS